MLVAAQSIDALVSGLVATSLVSVLVAIATSTDTKLVVDCGLAEPMS